MIVTCPNCSTRYNLPDDKIPEGGAKVKCSKCTHVFKTDPPKVSVEEEVESLLESDSPADTQAGDDFDETFDEVAAGSGDDEAAAEEAPADEPSAADESADSAGDDFADDLDDLFGDDEDDVAEEASASAADSAADDVDALFGDDDDEDDTPESDSTADDVDALFGDDDDDEPGAADEPGGDDGDDLGDLFDDAGDDGGEDDDDADDLFEDADGDDDEDYDDDDGDVGLDFDEKPAPKKGGGKSFGCLIILLILILTLGAGIYFKVWTLFGLDLSSYFANVPVIGSMFMEETGESGGEPAPGESPADRVRNIELKNVKQYYVANEKVGNVFVVEGKAVNKFATPKEQIKVEVVLYDGQGNVLRTESFLCGNVLSQFQLQVQTEEEIKDGLASEVGILSNNTFIRPGASTPFMAVFFQPPGDVKEFLVRVVDVGDPE